jgi:Domain of unknown function (DUF4331)
MSSHREAPEIAKDPVADSTDVYAFVSPDRPDTVTLIANYVPLQEPGGGPNFYEFGDDVLYELNINNDGDPKANITFEFRFNTVITNKNTFLYNNGPITTLDDANWIRRQFYSVTRIDSRGRRVLANKLPCPPCNIGVRSTPNYAELAKTAVHSLPGGIKVFAGQRREGFYVDLGSIFDLAALRPFQNLHLIPLGAMAGVDATKNLNVHTIALQIPKDLLTKDGYKPTNYKDSRSTIGFWTAAKRQKIRIYRNDDDDEEINAGPWRQISRLGNPLFNEVLVAMSQKDAWNRSEPRGDAEYQRFVEQPELAKLLPVLYPGVFPRLAALTAKRADLVAILLTGIPDGLIPGFQNFTGNRPADMLRLNMAIPPSQNPNPFGILGGDLAGFPNGRRVADNVVAIELRAVAGVTYPLIDPNFKPDDAAGLLTDGTMPGDDRYIPVFPYLGVPKDGFNTPSAAA